MISAFRRAMPALALAAALATGVLGCIPRPAVPDGGKPSPEEIWQNRIERSVRPGPAVLSGSVRFGTAGETTRAAFSWRSNGRLPASVILTDPVGSAVAQIAVSDEMSIVFVPSENKVYRYEEGERQLGLPCGYAELACLLAGDYFAFLGSPEEKALLSQTGADMTWSFAGDKGKGVLHITQAGPLTVEKDGWKLEISERDGLPVRLDAVKEEYRFVMVIRERTPSTEFAPGVFAMP